MQVQSKRHFAACSYFPNLCGFAVNQRFIPLLQFAVNLLPVGGGPSSILALTAPPYINDLGVLGLRPRVQDHWCLVFGEAFVREQGGAVGDPAVTTAEQPKHNDPSPVWQLSNDTQEGRVGAGREGEADPTRPLVTQIWEFSPLRSFCTCSRSKAYGIYLKSFHTSAGRQAGWVGASSQILT